MTPQALPKMVKIWSKIDPKWVPNRTFYTVNFPFTFSPVSGHLQAAPGSQKGTPKRSPNPSKIDPKTVLKRTSISDTILDPLGVHFGTILGSHIGTPRNLKNQ